MTEAERTDLEIDKFTTGASIQIGTSLPTTKRITSLNPEINIKNTSTRVKVSDLNPCGQILPQET